MAKEKVLVLNATGKVGRNVCRALLDAGFEVYGTTRSENSPLASQGIKPVVCNYTIRYDLDKAFKETGAKKVFVITDYFGAAKSNADLEYRQGQDAIDAAKAAGVDHLIFMSVADAEFFNEHVKHLKAKVALEKYVRESGVPYSILRPCAFFENFDDPANWNPLKKGVVKFLTEQDCKYCATYDIGRSAAIQFKNPQEWLGKTLDVIAWQGNLSQVAKALSRVSGVPVKAKLAMPKFLRKLFLKDLHHMFLYYEDENGPRGTPQEFKKVLPDAMSAEDWFRFHGKYSNGEKIVSEK
ncbi:NmrA family NAD(P)-binding protein [Polynucleobacter sp. IMCC 30228]|uniref:NmrA family NAD(P)-binding protein n=1 Tax=Polynucleobacter sp. IMCC 30228 TaxID=2781011 RepID=UPI001F2D3D4D|nr:NmrA family NAD(P)-binding protein [Polynucleobacter sp. IMCC 30228]MCE7528230.1 NmrA family NAD(P)-binding protein [Polynucleobacter sp. IMCC 30228]